MKQTKEKNIILCYFRAYDQYNKTEPTYAQYCLFIYLLFIFSPTCFGKHLRRHQRDNIKITYDMHECDYKILKLVKNFKIFYKIFVAQFLHLFAATVLFFGLASLVCFNNQPVLLVTHSFSYFLLVKTD
jgi:hypothetical protein